MAAMLKGIFNRFFGSKPQSSPIPVASKPAPAGPLYFLDADEQGALFVRYVHVTSSANTATIEKYGLQPLSNASERLRAYLEKAFPGHDDPTYLVSLISKAPADARRFASLVTSRLQEELEGRSVVALLPLGAAGYLESAADNAVGDGGEFFRSARETLNVMLKENRPPMYPDATAVVYVARHYLECTDGVWHLAGLPDNSLDLVLGLKTNFVDEFWSEYGCNFPIHCTTGYAPGRLEQMSLKAYQVRSKAPISPSAHEVVEGMGSANSTISGQAQPA